MELTPASKIAAFVDPCCKNVTRNGAARLDMYQLVSTLVIKSARARAEAPLSDTAAGRGAASEIVGLPRKPQDAMIFARRGLGPSVAEFQTIMN